jgi:hypothetical protein
MADCQPVMLARAAIALNDSGAIRDLAEKRYFRTASTIVMLADL